MLFNRLDPSGQPINFLKNVQSFETLRLFRKKLKHQGIAPELNWCLLKSSILLPSLPRKEKNQIHNINCKIFSKSLPWRAGSFFHVGHHLTYSEEKTTAVVFTAAGTAAVFLCEEWISLCAGNLCTMSSKKKKKNVGNKKTHCSEPCETVHNQITGGSIF